LYQVHALDMWTYVSVLLVLPGIGLVAALLPARKAASIQPMQALRED
jgi:ABC-type lipoprotein release transport system permease subunit